MPEEILRENKMGTMPENKLLLSMAVPMMISMLVQALYNIVDSIFVSRICEDALTAVSMAFPLQNIIISIAVGFGVGINALLSRALGQKNAERVNQVAVNGLLLALLSYLLVLVAGLVGIRAYMRAQTDIESIVEYGITYLNICVLCSFGVFCEITFERFLQATGRTIYSMVTQLVGAITNIILDPILIFGLLGFPKMGIAGAAWATVIGQCLGAVVAVILNHCKNPEIHLRLRHNDPADSGTFLPGFGGHLAHHFADKQGKFRLFGGDVLCEHAAVQRIGLHGEGDRFRDQVRVYAQLLAGMGGAGKGHHILAIQVIEQIARAAANQADGPVRYQPAVDDRFDHGLGQLGGGGGWLDDGRHPGKPGWRQLFQHAPAGEVKGVDMHRDAGF